MRAAAAYVDGIGFLGPGLADWPQAARTLRAEAPWQPAATVLPAPQSLPSAERRRTGVPVKLSLAVGLEACTMAGVEAATLVIALDLAGVAVSSGSACSSGKVAPSHVLAAMGVKPELARGAIRLSLGWASAEADVDRFAEAFRSVLARMRTARRGAA